MIHAAPHSITHGHSHDQDGVRPVKNPARNSDHAGASRRWFANMLWRAFPAASERELAAIAAPVLGCSERQVVNWLRCEHDAGLRYVTAVIALAGAEVVFKRIEGA